MRKPWSINLWIWGTATTILLPTSFILAADQPGVQWNERAMSRILNGDQLSKLTEVNSKFGASRIRQITWPTSSEVASKSVPASEALREACMKWLRKFVKQDYLLADLPKNLVAMKNWGPTGRDSGQSGLDAFIVRFAKGSHTIQIYESPGSIIVAVADEQLGDKPRTDHRDWALEVAALLLNEALKPEPDLKDVHVSESVSEGRKLSRISWLVGSVTVRKGKRRLTNGIEAARVGASSVEAETDGRFVVFIIHKVTQGPTEPDPHTPRF